MKIQHKLTLVSSMVFGLVLTFSSGLIYLNFIESAENIFFEELGRKAALTALFYLEEDEMSSKEFSRIEQKFLNATVNQEIRLYDRSGNIHFGKADPDTNITSKILSTIRDRDHYSFKVGSLYYYAIYYRDNQGSFSVIIKANNPTLSAQENEFLKILLTALLIGIVVIVVLSYTLSRVAYQPIRGIIHQVQSLDMTGKKQMLTYPKTKDELEDLFKEFNGMLEKSYKSIQIQKNFINHASHELKSPLASIVGNLEVLLNKERSVQEYQNTIGHVLSDAERLGKILENLLTLAGLDQSAVEMNTLERIDEILWEVLDQLKAEYPGTIVNLLWQLPEDRPELLSFVCNRTQLYIALYNLIENAAKFSDGQPVDVQLLETDNRLMIEIRDRGIGIKSEDLVHIAEPFYRGGNTSHRRGNGLGMAIVTRIFEKHQIVMKIDSAPGKGTAIRIRF
ncbi:sensor histidine kinase [Dyadobacter crusticola]|uniref:sensor histidine kinase n=1 Tax=Dyadobacter crusticola TaxID=292407 RepID=UPI0004E28A12|nr:HAMP domain-containing sensor histidine kinase [Dyadobacter crusticola]